MFKRATLEVFFGFILFRMHFSASICSLSDSISVSIAFIFLKTSNVHKLKKKNSSAAFSTEHNFLFFICRTGRDWETTPLKLYIGMAIPYESSIDDVSSVVPQRTGQLISSISSFPHSHIEAHRLTVASTQYNRFFFVCL